jgi:hypothetical protein
MGELLQKNTESAKRMILTNLFVVLVFFRGSFRVLGSGPVLRLSGHAVSGKF